MKRFLLLGDSITEQSVDFENGGWALRLLSQYRRRVDIIPRGFSGYNTRWILDYLNKGRIVPLSTSDSNLRFDLATVFLGANDAVEENAYQHVPIEEYKENLKKICEALQEIPRIILVTPPPYSAEKYKKVMNYPVSVRSDENAKRYAQAVQEVVDEINQFSASSLQQVVCANINDYFREKLPEDKWVDALSDGLHFGPLGNFLMAEAVLNTILKYFPLLHPSNLLPLLPNHKCFNRHAEDYEAASPEEEELISKVRNQD
jgi:lysophospholipase L1-like esterase